MTDSSIPTAEVVKDENTPHQFPVLLIPVCLAGLLLALTLVGGNTRSIWVLTKTPEIEKRQNFREDLRQVKKVRDNYFPVKMVGSIFGLVVGVGIGIGSIGSLVRNQRWAYGMFRTCSMLGLAYAIAFVVIYYASTNAIFDLKIQYQATSDWERKAINDNRTAIHVANVFVGALMFLVSLVITSYLRSSNVVKRYLGVSDGDE